MPADLGRPLLLRVLAYKLQAQRLGDLDRASRRALAALAVSADPAASAAPAADDDRDDSDHDRAALAAGASSGATGPVPVRLARPGTVLLREHDGVVHRVTVLADGVSWSGRRYDSLSQVAFAITGTRWNGPRFFGLRGKPAAGQGGASPGWSTVQADASVAAPAARRAARSTSGMLAAPTGPSPARGTAP